MVLRKITIDNSVKYIPITEKDIKQKTTKNKNQSEKIKPVSGGGKSNMRKQDKQPSQNNKKFLKNISASGFGYITK